jgi:hypothetical protein
MSSNSVGHLITNTATKLQHFATHHHTSSNYTSLHLSTLHFLSFGLTHPHFLPFCFTPHPQTRHGTVLPSPNYFQNNEPQHFPKETLTISLHFLFINLFFPYPMNASLQFTLLFTSTTHFPSLFTFYRLHFSSLVFTFQTLVLKMYVLP